MESFSGDQLLLLLMAYESLGLVLNERSPNKFRNNTANRQYLHKKTEPICHHISYLSINHMADHPKHMV